MNGDQEDSRNFASGPHEEPYVSLPPDCEVVPRAWAVEQCSASWHVGLVLGGLGGALVVAVAWFLLGG